MFDNYADEIQALKKASHTAASSRPVAFYGSSSFRLWETLADDFADVPILNLGFGGSTTEECVYFFDRLVPPATPRALFLYAGDNDLGQGQTPDQVVGFFCTLHDLVETRLGSEMPFLFVSIKPSLARWNLQDAIQETNARIQAEIAKRPRSVYVDIWMPSLGPDGLPNPVLLIEDGLHPSPAGYDVWRQAISEHRPGNF